MPVRDLAIIVGLVVMWCVLRLVLPADGTWRVVRLLADLVLTLATIAMGVRLWRHITARDAALSGHPDVGAPAGTGHRPAGKPQSTTTGTVPHH